MTGPIPAAAAERAATRYVVEGECHLSTYSRGSHGYAQVGWQIGGGKIDMTTAHRAAFVHYSGEQIPSEATVDHLCHNRPCVRRDHLRLLSNEQNARRNSPSRDFPLGWSCRRGHGPEYQTQVKRKTKTGEPRLGWTCRACLRINRDKWARNNPEKVKASVKKYNDSRPRKTNQRRGKAA